MKVGSHRTVKLGQTHIVITKSYNLINKWNIIGKVDIILSIFRIFKSMCTVTLLFYRSFADDPLLQGLPQKKLHLIINVIFCIYLETLTVQILQILLATAYFILFR